MKTAFALSLALGAAVIPSQASAALTMVGQFSGNECGGMGGFSNCYASATGTSQGSGSAGTIAKFGTGGLEDQSTHFPSIDGSEFTVSYTAGMNNSVNQLSFSYTPGANDPAIYYVAVKQAKGFVLFSDTSPITSGVINLTTYFPKNPGYSHITFFGSPGAAPGVPEPATWGLLILGFGAIGGALRRRASRTALQYV